MSRQIGKSYEAKVVRLLRPIFPLIRRNWLEQSAKGGSDLVNTGRYAIEVKGGTYAKIAKVKKWLEQARKEAEVGKIPLVIVCPRDEKPYVVMDLENWLNLVDKDYKV